MSRFIQLFKETFRTQDFYIFDVYQPSHENNEFFQEHNEMISLPDISWYRLLN